MQRVARGESRPDLRERIEAAIDCHRRAAARLAARYQRELVTHHIRDGLKGKGEPARRCREYVMTRYGGDPEKLLGQDEAGAAPVDPLAWMTEEDYAMIAALKRGRGGAICGVPLDVARDGESLEPQSAASDSTTDEAGGETEAPEAESGKPD